MNRLYYLGKPGDGTGWAIANTNLIRELSKLCEVVPDDGARVKFDAPVFVPIVDSALKPLRRVKRAPRVLGYCFTEWPLTDDAVRNARHYNVLFGGSTWNIQRLADKGIKSVPLIQGIDFERFSVQQPSERKGFVVFSGGKYEFRKAQDIVIAAMRTFMKVRGDVTLLTSWFNPWPQSAESMRLSWHVDYTKPCDGLPEDRVIHLPPIANEKMPAIYAQAHIGLFPNRCEAGTNLVMCEFMACGRPVIASYAHGHKDVLNESAYLIRNGTYDPAGWFNAEVSDCIFYLEQAYAKKETIPERGLHCRKGIEHLTWEACAKTIYEHAFKTTSSDLS